MNLPNKLTVIRIFMIPIFMIVVLASWVIAIIVCRELAVTGLRLLIVEQGGGVMAAAMPGKIKTATQMVGIVLLYLNNVPFNFIGIPMDQIMLYICLFFTVYSGYDYFAKNTAIFKGSM